MGHEPSIVVRNLTKVYRLYNKPIDRVKEALSPFHVSYHRDFYALRDISFEVEKGKTVAIIGRNGSGKSTLLKLITGVATPTSGVVSVSGRVAALLALGAGFNPELTGIQNIFLYGSVIGYAKDEMEKRLDNILSFADIGDFVYQPLKLYSSGMFSRLAFATYINVDPDVLIVDEVLSVGDIRFQLKCRDKLMELRDKGTTILYVSHSNQGIGDYAMMLEKGEITMSGQLLDVWNHYHRLMTDNRTDAPQIVVPSLPGAPPQVAATSARAEAGEYAPCVEGNGDGARVEVHTSGHRSCERAAGERRLVYRESPEFLARVEKTRFGTSEVRIVNAEMLNEKLEQVTAAEWGQELSYRIHLRVEKDVPFLGVGFMIRNNTGLHFLGDESWAQRVPMMDLRAGDTIVVEFAFDVNFIHGQYTVTAACSYRNVEMPGECSYFDWVDNCDVLEVLPRKRPFHALYYVPTKITTRIARESGHVPADLPAMIAKYEKLSSRSA